MDNLRNSGPTSQISLITQYVISSSGIRPVYTLKETRRINPSYGVGFHRSNKLSTIGESYIFCQKYLKTIYKNVTRNNTDYNQCWDLPKAKPEFWTQNIDLSG